VLTLISSISTTAFVTATVFAKKRSSGGGGGSSDNGSGTTNTGGSDNSNSGSGGTSNTTPTPPATTQQTCPDGSTPDSNGNCPTPTPPKEQNTVPPTIAPPPQTSDIFATPPPSGIVGNTPTQQQLDKCAELGVSPSSPVCQRITGTAPGGGTMPATPTPPPATPPTATPPVQPLPTTPPPTTSPLTQQQLDKCAELGVSPSSPVCQRITGTAPGGGTTPATPPPATPPTATPPVQPLAKQNTGVLPVNPDGSCPPGYAKIDIRCVGVLPGSTTGPGGGFIQMIPTKPQPAVNGPQATQTPATAPQATPPALPPTVCPPNQHYDTSQQKCVDVLK
jgi:hypothetical protein